MEEERNENRERFKWGKRESRGESREQETQRVVRDEGKKENGRKETRETGKDGEGRNLIIIKIEDKNYQRKK